MKLLIVLFILYPFGFLFAQTLQGVPLDPCYALNEYHILVDKGVSCDSAYTYYIRHNADKNNDSIIDYGSSYELVGQDENGQDLVLLRSEYENYEQRYAIYNLTTGKRIAEVHGEPEDIIYHSEDQVIILNHYENHSGFLLSSLGDTLLTKRGTFFSKCDLGYYTISNQEDETFYNKKGEAIKTLKNFDLYQQVGPNDYLGWHTHKETNMTAPLIVDSTGKILFIDECGYGIVEVRTSPYSNQPILLAQGFCDIDDSFTIIQKKKGKWKMPLYKLSSKEYFTNILPLNDTSLYSGGEINNKTPYYYTTDGYENSTIRDKKGNVILQLETTKSFQKIVADEHFVYGYENDYFSLFDLSGNSLLATNTYEKLPLDESIEDAGFYAFQEKEDEYNTVYLYHTTSGELRSFHNNSHELTDLETIKTFFKELEPVNY
ncbi:hypothetical protein [Parvicella tangerina]|uniref:Uncharacterized protein n=1 Tax=Parvicella tangerina TaxID=2829795 RepID=A0A916NEM1_9FLAO|nr:hypothetical protein [Parvicella tangerina]CAG5076510.1 hypothetical protein CRYO30217_00125 [Parvicella tangerina]